jgi:DNA-binding transcriptional regulator YhcF (GntR family)
MEKEILKKQKQSSKEGYVVVPNYFLREWVKVLGVGPAMLYLYLLTYCHKGKDIAWPTISTLSKKMNLTPKTINKYLQSLVKYGLIKKVSKRKTSSGCHIRNIYQLTPFDMEKNTLPMGNIFSCLEGNFTPDIGENLPTNNNNLKHYQFNNNKEKEDAVVVAVDFKKLKEEGEEKMQAIKEQMVELDFEEELIEKILKEYSTKKIDEKLDLLIERKNIKNPAGWLRSALKNDYQDREQERYDEEPVKQVSRQTPLSHLNSTPSMGKKFRETIVIDSHLSPEERKIQSRERILKIIRKTQKMLANLKTKGETNVRAKISN